ncbi:LapA family protein [Pseudalkalibacillus berkeleyi]|uniref:Lipopolysaccharide assembly protein LapA domain-containing protein n=1 Tax=Pseudalkalibacillus berkeleyi TaxID=1069813 RepID=A0ABS9H2H7_9BACL|nr:lipopolysaccharide assembly protein LapA domain-containing protein [Pseudalkalibacillus berkeleyi]MCF6138063.1 lipopolysaccharide assembly protein LapA domain-containing protein [Pseudalkalibacillus berkeleyi]
MRREWSFIIVLLFAIVVAVFAVINVDSVEVHYLFGSSQWPLVLVILGSALLGAITIGFAGSVRFFSMRKELRNLQKENQQLTESAKDKQEKVLSSEKQTTESNQTEEDASI